MSPRVVVVAGSSGLVGREVLRLLIGDPDVSRITNVVRRPLANASIRKVEEIVADFTRLELIAPRIAGDQLISALGTTIGAAGSQEAFRAVDFVYPLQLATIAHKAGIRHLLLVSAVGADASSRIFYNCVKGDLEDAVAALGFRSLTIARPSLLVGERVERRIGEEIARRFAFITPIAYKPVHVRQVAAALVQAARDDAPGTRIIDNRTLHEYPLA
ncbi:MAG: NAD(P)H-binding protein [Gemmatimonadaceae bacterium]